MCSYVQVSTAIQKECLYILVLFFSLFPINIKNHEQACKNGFRHEEQVVRMSVKYSCRGKTGSLL